MAKAVANFEAMCPQLDDIWFERVLAEAWTEVGALPPERVKKAIGVAYEAIGRRIGLLPGQYGFVPTPRPFAASTLKGELARQQRS